MPDREPAELIRHVQHLLNDAKGGNVPESDAIELCALARELCRDSFTDVRWLGKAGAIGMMLNHPLVTKYRTIDPMYFAAITLMCIGGGRVRNVLTTIEEKIYAHLEYEGRDPALPGNRVHLVRIITGAPTNRDVDFIGDRHFYCRVNLKAGEPGTRGGEASEPGRERAIELARELYETSGARTPSWPSADRFEALLRHVFVTADAVHSDTSEVR